MSSRRKLELLRDSFKSFEHFEKKDAKNFLQALCRQAVHTYTEKYSKASKLYSEIDDLLKYTNISDEDELTGALQSLEGSYSDVIQNKPPNYENLVVKFEVDHEEEESSLTSSIPANYNTHSNVEYSSISQAPTSDLSDEESITSSMSLTSQIQTETSVSSSLSTLTSEPRSGVTSRLRLKRMNQKESSLGSPKHFNQKAAPHYPLFPSGRDAFPRRIPSHVAKYQEPQIVPGLTSSFSQLESVFREEVTEISDYLGILEIRETPYQRLKNVDLAAMVVESRPRIRKEMAAPPPPNDGWGYIPKRPKLYFAIVANIIKRKGNLGIDRGSMAGPVDSICDRLDGGEAYYYVLEEKNKRVQTFFVPPYRDDEINLLESRNIYNGSPDEDIKSKTVLAANVRWLAYYEHVSVAEGPSGDLEKRPIIFLMTKNPEDPNKAHVKQYEGNFEKIRDFKLQKIKDKKENYCKLCGLCVTLGNIGSPESRLITFAMQGNDNTGQSVWYLISWKLLDQTKGEFSKEEAKFLNKDQSRDDIEISFVTSWSDQLYISDSGRHQVYLTDLKGNLRKQIGAKGSVASDADGCFNHPGSIVVDSKGNFLVADELNNRIQIFDCVGNFLGHLDTCYVRRPCGLILLDDERLIFFSRDECSVIIAKLSPSYEEIEYKRPMSEGSKRFFRVNERNTGGGRGRGRGLVYQTGKYNTGSSRASSYAPSTATQSNISEDRY